MSSTGKLYEGPVELVVEWRIPLEDAGLSVMMKTPPSQEVLADEIFYPGGEVTDGKGTVYVKGYPGPSYPTVSPLVDKHLIYVDYVRKWFDREGEVDNEKLAVVIGNILQDAGATLVTRPLRRN